MHIANATAVHGVQIGQSRLYRGPAAGSAAVEAGAGDGVDGGGHDCDGCHWQVGVISIYLGQCDAIEIDLSWGLVSLLSRLCGAAASSTHVEAVAAIAQGAHCVLSYGDITRATPHTLDRCITHQSSSSASVLSFL